MSRAALALEDYAVATSEGNPLVRVSFSLERPAVVGIVGPAGAGKTILLRALSHDLPRGTLASGKLVAKGEPVERVHLPTAYFLGREPMQTRNALLRHLTKDVPADVRETRVEHTLRTAGLWDEFQHRLTAPLRDFSPTERMMLDACRGLVLEADALLLDDPTAQLDPMEASAFARVIKALSQQIPVLWATRALRRVSPVADWLVVLAEGRMTAEGSAGRVVISPPPEAEKAVEAATGQSAGTDMEGLFHDLLAMGSRAERAVHLAVRSLTDQNLPVAREVIENDEDIDRREQALRDQAMAMIGCVAPVGRDLRTLTTIIKAAGDLERIADHATNISEIALAIGGEPLIKPLIDIPRMAEKAQQMVRQSLDAMVRQDVELARSVCASDAPVDALYRELFEELLGFITDGGDAYRAGQALYLLFVARYLERVADHATNIAEHVIFMVTGERVPHQLETEKPISPFFP